MLEYYYKQDMKILRLRGNCLADILEEMAAIYHEWGMGYHTAVTRLNAVSHFGDWLRKKGIKPKAAVWEDAARFIARFVPPNRRGRNGSRYFLKFRAGANMAFKLLRKKYPPKSPPPSFTDLEIAAYADFLRQKRALTERSVENHVFFVRPFLEAMFAKGPIRPSRIGPMAVQRYVLELRQRYQPQSASMGSARMNSLFKYWTLMGHDTRLLSAAIPKFRISRRCLPHTIIAEEYYGTLWESFDRDTDTGRRDYAAIRCMADLGIRVGDATDLTLDDINWRKSEIRVPNGKTGMALWLPLPKTLGEALVDYLHHGRPKSQSRIIFLRHRGPRIEPCGTAMIRSAFRYALIRAGLHGKYTGTHTLRHSLATRLRRVKVSVKDMADVLGHCSLESTTIYAQVDQPALRAVAQPWPEGAK